MSGRQPKNQATASQAPETFLLLDENAFAHTAVQQLLRCKPNSPARLIYLYGPSGSGKSLLVRYYLRELRAASSRRKIVHFTASEFAAELAEASSESRVADFQKAYWDADVLVCEDIASLENRYESQQQLVSLVDSVLSRGGECLLTSRVAPGEIPHFNVRLVNRCHGGVCASMELPGRSSRLKLLQHFAQIRQMPVTPEAAEMLADELPVSPRELMATVNQLDTLGRARGGIVDQVFVRRYLDDETKPQPQTLPRIADAVARHFGVSVGEMRTSSRARDQVLPRQCAMLLARQLTSESLGVIADYFGRRNHSTVIHACNRLECELAAKPALRKHLLRIRRSLGAAGSKGRRKRVEKCAVPGVEKR